MLTDLLLEIAVLVVLVAGLVATWRAAAAGTGTATVILAAAALTGAVAALATDLIQSGWHGDLAFTLRAILAATLFVYVGIGVFSMRVRRLGALLFPYLLLIGVVALVIGLLSPDTQPGPVAAIAWLDAHIVFALATYALLTLAAMAGLACLIQESGLKRKSTGGLASGLPSVSDSERAEIRLLGAAEIVLFVGIATGMTLGWIGKHRLVPFDHKTMLAIAAFLLIGLLLWAHGRTGYRGRRAARWVLVAWILLTLAYPGVKFVREILLG
jgi:ABC-type uncharacterized transport system permease subunit